MDALDQSLLSTLAYYGALGRALTPMEFVRRMIPVRTLSGAPLVAQPVAILRRLESLAVQGVVQSSLGYQVLSQDAALLDERLSQEQWCALKWRRMRRYAWWLQAVPFVRALFASGSLALGTTDASSDWDMFVIARQGRLYTARTALLGVAWLMGRLRTKRTQNTNDRFCFNHYVTTNGLSIRHRSVFMAHSMASMIPVLDPHGYLVRLWQANRWIGDYCSATQGTSSVRRTVASSRVLRAMQRLIELPLRSPLGDGLEWALRRWQQRRIQREPLTHAPGGRIVADLVELEFHPRSFEVVALARYNAALRQLGLASMAAHDSGLHH